MPDDWTDPWPTDPFAEMLLLKRLRRERFRWRPRRGYQPMSRVVVREFIERCLRHAPGHQVTAANLNAQFRAYCRSHGKKPISQRLLGLELARQRFEKRKQGSIFYLGIDFSDDLHRWCQVEPTEAAPASAGVHKTR